MAKVSPRLIGNLSESTITSNTLRVAAVAILVVYLGWNAYWLSQRAIPPSLFSALTGLPCPTTGGTRAIRCLLAGDVRESLRFNAMTIPLVAMFVVTLVVAASRFRSRRACSLPAWFVPAWFGLLAVAWVLKLTGLRSYW